MQTLQSTPQIDLSPEQAIIKKVRNRLNLPLTEPENIVYKIAATQHELEAAFRLTHDSYVKRDYINPLPSKMKFTIYNALPKSTTVIGLENNTVFSTISLMPDSPLGLPMDCIYKHELDSLREMGRVIVEIGSLVSTVNSQNTVIYMAKLIFFYARDYLGIDDLVCAVHPKHLTFYESILCYKKIGGLKSYSNANDNPAVAIHLDLHNFENTTWEAFDRNPVEKDLHHFFFVNPTQSVKFPAKKQPLEIWNNRKLNYFFKEKTNIFNELDTKTKTFVNKIYPGSITC